MARGLTTKEAKIVEAFYFSPHYSGDEAAKFWIAVNHPANDRTLFDFACALQEMESRVLAVLNAGVRVRARKLILALRIRETAGVRRRTINKRGTAIGRRTRRVHSR